MVTRKLLVVICTVALLAGCGKKEDSSLDGKDDVSGVSFTPDRITLKEVEFDGLELMELEDDSLTFHGPDGVDWVAPKGTLTDGATVPRLALWVTDGRFDSKFLKAAIIHDAFCQSFNETRCPEQFHSKPWEAVHRMFYDACVAGGTPPTRAQMMFAAVWLGGPRWNVEPDGDLENVSDEVLRAGFDACTEFIEEKSGDEEGDGLSLEEIETWMDKREPTIVEVSNLETEGIAALNAGDVAKAEEKFQKSDAVLTKALDVEPEDTMFLSLKGYHHKNLAAEYSKLDMREKRDKELTKADNAFKKVIARQPKNPSALNGMGSVEILRNNLEQGEKYKRDALKVAPALPSAKRDLQRIETMRNRGGPR